MGDLFKFHFGAWIFSYKNKSVWQNFNYFYNLQKFLSSLILNFSKEPCFATPSFEITFAHQKLSKQV
jgi:UDP-galactopyranose mutase